MVLAEALLRVPDAATADRLIEDKLAAGDWSEAGHAPAPSWSRPRPGRSASRRASSSPAKRRRTSSRAWSSGSACRRCRLATRQAMRLLGSHFVLGQTIEEALSRAGSHREFRYSFDMLGEGARTAADAGRYFDAYADAIEAIGARAGNAALPARPGISVKLSALHPRYEAVSRERVLRELAPRVLELARARQAPRSQLHRRCRGGRPARTVARGDRRGAGRSVARRLGRLRACGAGLSEARRRGDRLARRRRATRSTAA